MLLKTSSLPNIEALRFFCYFFVVVTTASWSTDAYVPGSGCVGPVSSVARSPGLMDVFTIGADGKVYTAAWTPRDISFRGWWQVIQTDGIEVPPCSSVSAISRSRDKLDIFVTAIDGRVFTASWAQGDTDWQGWSLINAVIFPGAPIEVVSRADGKLDLFATGLDERVWHASYQHGEPASTRWRPIKTLIVSPGSSIGAVSRAENKIDIFVTGGDGLIYSSFWEPGLADFRDWVHIGGRTTPGTPITAVSRSANMIDLFLIGLDGNVWTSHSRSINPIFSRWRAIPSVTFPACTIVSAVAPSIDQIHIFSTSTSGIIFTTSWKEAAVDWSTWESVHSGVTLPGAPVSALSRGPGKIDVFVTGTDAKVGTSAWQTGRSGFGNWASVGNLIGGMTDPEPSRWTEEGIAYWAENTDYSDEAQGITTDNSFWYLSTNAENHKSIRKIDNAGKVVSVLEAPWDDDEVHPGASSYYRGWIYVPIQRPYGVWKVRVDFASQIWLPVDTVDNRLSMAAVNPLNGRLYTARFDIQNTSPPTLYAYDRNTMERKIEDDILLGRTPITLANIQGAVFTDRGRVILVTSDAKAYDYENYLFVFSARTGYCFGMKTLGDFGSIGSETESVTIRPWNFGSKFAPVHVMELDNDIDTGDIYLHSYSVPFPNLL